MIVAEGSPLAIRQAATVPKTFSLLIIVAPRAEESPQHSSPTARGHKRRLRASLTMGDPSRHRPESLKPSRKTKSAGCAT